MPHIIAAVADLPNLSPLLRYAGSAAYARFCRRVHGDPRPWFDLVDRVQRDALAAALTGVRGPVADLGCGPGAFAGWLARRWHLWVGLASGLWALGLIGLVPAGIPIASGLWYAPTVLVMLSGWLSRVAVSVENE